jgi:hypothetical protein
MRTPEECLRHADEAERKAETVRDETNRAVLLRLAEHWRKLATQTEALARRTATNAEINQQLTAELKAKIEEGRRLLGKKKR